MRGFANSRLAIGAALAAGVLSLIPAQAANGWSRAALGASAPDQTGDASVVGNSRGDTAVTWPGKNGIQLAIARAGHGFRTPVRVPHSQDGIVPELAINGSGDVLVFWSYDDHTYRAPPYSRDDDCCFGVRLTVLDRYGRFSPVQTLTPKGHDLLVEAFAFGPGKRIGMTWQEQYSSHAEVGLRGRFSGSDGRLGPDVRLGPDFDYGVAVGFARGNPRVLIFHDHRPDSHLVERVGRDRRTFGPARLIAAGLPRSVFIAGDSNERGDEVVAWSRDNQYGDSGPVYAGVRSPGSRLVARRVGALGPDYDAPNVAIAPSGAATVAWEPSNREVVATARLSGGDFPAARSVVHPRHPNHVRALQLGVNSHGKAVIAWLEDRITGKPTIVTVFRAASGQTTVPTRVAGPAYSLEMAGGTAAIDRIGRATIAWSSGASVFGSRSSFR